MARKNSSGTNGRTASTRKGTTRTATARPPRTTRRGNGSARSRQTTALEPFVLSHDQIAARAYQLWQQTGNPDERHNWQEAERQLRAESARD